LGVPEKKIMPVPGDGHNTKTEMDDFLNWAVSQKWRTVIAITQPAHALRAMLGTVRSLQALGSQIRVYPWWSNRYDFTASSYGSQGEGPLPRSQWIDQEYDRIVRYQAKGDLASLEELHAYLRFLYQSLPQ
jgi:hypothetical protein